jgi:hypothetical protein
MHLRSLSFCAQRIMDAVVMTRIFLTALLMTSALPALAAVALLQ